MISKTTPRVFRGLEIVRNGISLARKLIYPKPTPVTNKVPGNLALFSAHTYAIQIEPANHPVIAETAGFEAELAQAKATISSLKAQAKQLIRRAEAAERLGQTDALTQLYNRGFGDIALSQAVSSAVRYDQPLSLIIFDIDYFKKINDRFGHSVGDKVLFAVAATIKNALRSADIPFRYGGEEFVVILPDTQISGAKIVAEKIRAAVEALKLDSKGEKITVTISGGIALLNKDEVSENLINRADGALYGAKKNGRNRIETAEQLAA